MKQRDEYFKTIVANENVVIEVIEELNMRKYFAKIFMPFDLVKIGLNYKLHQDPIIQKTESVNSKEHLLDSRIRSLVVYDSIKKVEISYGKKRLRLNDLKSLKLIETYYVPHDDRKMLSSCWSPNPLRQPLNLVRSYFGEKAALFYAWIDKDFKFGKLFDNELTIVFSFLVSIWSTILTEMWKRKSNELSYNWGTQDFEKEEITRPEWKPTKTRISLITGKTEDYYPEWLMNAKITFSLMIILLCVKIKVVFEKVAIVLISVTGIIVFRAWIRALSLKNGYNGYLSNFIASLFNLMSIILLSSVYARISLLLTKWENHKTDTQFEDSLILKLFLFDFINSYSSLFYIGYFKEAWGKAIFGNHEWNDTCTDSCLIDLMFQLVTLFIGNQFYNQFLNYFLP
ncbi:hypothetical protein ROZALSC1DRAFT_21527 [Rozella allomycis CSF55]|uniref:Anoctamin transmembrane domain-containing protein n=1 Tax=Rozella allomycis (strain CSF55) TaxID=988480 RepID=A0A4P9YLD0_ROZAC|nr:hypothetical protein ROZALSC1DRAFT_21527 [Rozella allomycis CSF55]